jgi:hypothetical protein
MNPLDYLQRFWEWTTHDAVSFYTAVLALFTIVLGVVSIVQIRYLRRADVTARTSADAARDSANAAIATETSRFYIVIVETNFDAMIDRIRALDLSQSLGTPIRIGYRFRNYGKTPGIIKSVCVDANIAAEPVDAVYPILLDPITENMVGAGDVTNTKTYLSPETPRAGQIDSVARNAERIWFYGRLDYVDVFGTPHAHRFYFRSVMANGRCFLQSFDYKHYNKSD